ncbi:MAG: hypothetical protein ACREQE_12000 [Candidatus Binataceae bacterium]
MSIKAGVQEPDLVNQLGQWSVDTSQELTLLVITEATGGGFQIRQAAGNWKAAASQILKTPPGEGSVWRIGPAPRGEAIEKILGQNLQQTFPVVDIFQNGTVTSIKSMNLFDKTYRDGSAVLRAGRGFVDKVAEFTGGIRSHFKIQQSQISGRAVMIAVPPGRNGLQAQALLDLTDYGLSKGVQVIIIVVK